MTLRSWIRKLFILSVTGTIRQAPRRFRPLLENLEERITPSTLDITGGALTYTAAPASASDLTVSVDPSNTSDVIFTEADQLITLAGAGTSGWTGNGTNTVTGPESSYSSIAVGGSTALGQILTIDYSGSATVDPLPASGLTYTPAAASSPATDSLNVISGAGGDTFTSETYLATGAGAGTITYSDSSNSNVPIIFSGLSPVNDTVPCPTFIFDAPASAATANIGNGPVVNAAQTDQNTAGGAGAFELINFANQTAVTVNVNNAGAAVSVDNSTAAAGPSALFVNSSAGSEAVDVTATSLGVATTVDTGSFAGSAINVTGTGGINGPLTLRSTGGSNTANIGSLAPALGGTLAGIDAAITVGSGITTLVIDDSGETTAETATVGLISNVPTVTGLDLGNSGSVADGGGAAITINGGSGGATFDVDESGGAITVPITVNGGGTSILNIEGGSFTTDTYNYTNAHDGNIDLDSNVINYTGLTPITNSGDAANEIFNLPNTSNTVTLQESGTPSTPLELVSGGAFESTEFTDPTSSLAINSFAGTTNTINVGGGAALADFNAALTIAGTTTDTVNVDTAATALTLGNGGANTGAVSITAGIINVDSVIDTTAGIAGAVTLTTNQDISLNSGSSITTSSGAITLTALGAVSGNYSGILLFDADVSSATGDILLTGQAGDVAGHAGILDNGSQIASTGAATVTLDGTGGAGDNDGVVLQSNGAVVTSAGGAIYLTGQGGNGTGGGEIGIAMFVGGQITSPASAPITLWGTAGNGSGVENAGVVITSGLVSSANGAVQITGVGGAGSASDDGIYVLNGAGSGQVESTGTAPITLTGTGGGGTASHGVQISGSGSTVEETGGSPGSSASPARPASGLTATGSSWTMAATSRPAATSI